MKREKIRGEVLLEAEQAERFVFTAVVPRFHLSCIDLSGRIEVQGIITVGRDALWLAGGLKFRNSRPKCLTVRCSSNSRPRRKRGVSKSR